MSQPTDFIIGSDVSCTDGACGELRRVVVDPVAKTLTHLVVEAKHRQGMGHLVPLELVTSSGAKIELSCSTAEFEELRKAEEIEFLPGARGQWGYGQDQMLSHPYYGLGMGGMGGMGGSGMMGGMAMGMTPSLQAITSDVVPDGRAEVRRGDQVHASDGPIGKVQGLVVDPRSHHMTHVLLDEGHLWGKKRVAIPIGAVTSVGDGVEVNLTKEEVGDLPPVELDDEE